MQYYKVLDLDCTEAAEKLKFFYLMNRDKFQFWTDADLSIIKKICPELQEIFDPLQLTIQTVAFVKMDENQSPIHRDLTSYSARINIPVLHCENTVTKFFTSQAEPRIIDVTPPIPAYKAEDCVEVASVVLSKPTVLRIREIHQIISNNPYKPRVSCTIGFKETLDHLFDE